MYDQKLNEFAYEIPGKIPTRELRGRKFYASFVLDDTFYFHGGLDSKDIIINEFIAINLNTLVWDDVNL